MAGQVRRYHTWPVLRQQSLAEHQWQVWRLVRAIHPSASQDLQTAALTHDVGEVATGDMPSYAKNSEALRAVLCTAETRAHQQMVLPWSLPAPRPLAGFEQWVLTLADVLERWEFALEEMYMGNRFALLIAGRAVDSLQQAMLAREDDPYLEVCERLRSYMQRRTATWPVE
jgi:5'-deoxynucleotidase YfbR-like HD superfamily hydrolase